MNMLEALLRISGKNNQGYVWARPVSWRGTGRGITYDRGEWKTVPSGRGGEPTLLPSRADVLGEWEVVEPKAVNEEAK